MKEKTPKPQRKRTNKKEEPVKLKAWTTVPGGLGSLHRVCLEIEDDKIVNVERHPEDMPHIVYAKILREMQYESKQD